MRSSFDKKLLQLKYENEFCIEVDCSEDENQTYLDLLRQKKDLPIDIVQYEESNGAKLNKFYRVVPMPITHEELQEYCSLKQIKNLNTIKNCVLFFTALTVIFLFATIILFVSQM